MKSLRRAEGEAEALLDAIPAAAALFDRDGAILDANEAFLSLFGFPGKEAALLFSAEDISLSASEPDEPGLPSLIRDAAGSLPRPAQWRAKLFREKPLSRGSRSGSGQEEGEIGASFMAEGSIRRLGTLPTSGVLVIARNADCERSAEEDNRRVREESLRSARMEAAAMVAGAAADEFNNILTGIFGNISLLKIMCESGQSSDISQAAERIRAGMDGCLRAGEAVRKLKDISSSGTYSLGRIDLGTTLKHTVRICEHAFGDAVRIEFEEPLRAYPVLGDHDALERTILNACINAYHSAEAAAAGSSMGTGIAPIRVSISAVTPDPRLPGLFPVIEEDLEYARVSISDSGEALDPSALRGMFDPFVFPREDGSAPGFGMAVAYSTMRAHGGSIDIDSVPGRGTTLALHVPMIKEMPEAAPGTADDGIVRGSGRVLLAFGKGSARLGMQGMLKASGYSVVSADSASAAAAAWLGSEEGFDALILDFSGSYVDAMECYETVSKRDPGARILLVTGIGEDALIVERLGIPADCVLRRPVSLRSLSARMASLKNSRDAS